MIIKEIDPYFEPKITINEELLNEQPEVIVIDLAERDNKIELLHKILKQRKQQMMNQYKYCKHCILENNNSDINNVIENYQNYFQKQINNKEKQIQNMKLLDLNLNELLNNKTLSDENLKTIKKDQEEIVKKMDKLDDELKNLLDVIKN